METVDRLRRQVAELDRTRSLIDGRQLHTARYCDSGSLVRLIDEYFTLFRHGLREVSSLDGASKKRSFTSAEEMEMLMIQTQRKEAFLHQIIDADAIVGNFKGPVATIEQWRWYTAVYDHVRAEILSVTASGTQDHPMVVLKSQMYATISFNTFRLMFSRALHRHDLQLKFLGRRVVYPC